MSRNNSLTFIDLFAGIGGIRIGFEEVFGECLFSSEFDKHAQITYKENFGHIPQGDITLIDEKSIPNFDILLAGFPCQPFSNAGLKLGFEDTRGTLFFHIAKILDYHRPEIVFLENVKGLKSHNKGQTYKIIEKTLEDMGYNVYSKVLNAKDFGVPQNRERIYIIGFKQNVNFSFPKPCYTETRLGNILEPEVNEKYTISDRLWAGHQRRKKEHLAKGNGFGYSLFNHDSKYTSTISARYYKDGSEILIEQDNKNPRKITPREAARLQGFPEWFKIPVSDTQAYKQFGNSVCVPVINAIANQIKSALEKPRIHYKPKEIDLFNYSYENRKIAYY
ncbi:MAG: DNA (cytosine-5-)-methyltransferase [Alphaproteobacteria bacterium CG11_big_fil_rev_8_21_14_0_20_39_49]|nr:MAG: DNA (cytosine-5-)-methyltransferase [Alphaproteobacteria bacterium CG11_big_fil_rev_8_21_14_0_20_39_49]